jgi:uncharacterized cupin superfamily protein
MGYHVLQEGDHVWDERAAADGTPQRYSSDVTTAGGLQESRARLWRLLPHSRGPRHIENVQEEVFVVLEGTLTMLLGDPPERVAVAKGGVITLEPHTGIQLRNESDAEVTVFAYGAPPVPGQAEYLDDVEL